LCERAHEDDIRLAGGRISNHEFSLAARQSRRTINRQRTDLSCKNFLLINARIGILLLFAARLSIRANGKTSHMSGLGHCGHGAIVS
jgi:hypothetical protein